MTRITTRPRTGGATLLLVATLIAVPAARATTVLLHSVDEMARRADVVIHARVGDQRVVWDETRTRILTLSTVEVIEAIKGTRKGDLMTIYQVGGSLDGYTIRIPGTVHLRPGEEVVFFAMRFKDMIVPYGIGLGKYLVTDHEGTKAVTPERGSVSFVKPAPGGGLEPTTPAPPRTRQLPEFLAEVRQAIVAGGTP